MTSLMDAAPDEVLRRLQLTVWKRLDGLLQGDYRGLVPGHGSEPGETRAYQPGDDVRRIDWNVTARMRDVHLRETIADRELELHLVCDLTASLGFGTVRTTKQELAVSAATAVALLAGRSGNRIGAILGVGDEHVHIPARTGRDALMAVLHRLVSTRTAEGSGGGDLAALLFRAHKLARRRGMVVVVSDFLDASNWDRALRALTVRHEVLVIEVVDRRELSIPDVGLVMLRDPETGRTRSLDTGKAEVRERFATAAAAQREDFARRIRRSGAAHLQLRTDRDWVVDMARFVSQRRHVAVSVPT
jgi:uncharacterized protein (DUF58 family)